MCIKKGSRMIRLCNLLHDKSMQFAAQQTRVLLHPGTYLVSESSGDTARYAVPKSTQSNVTY